jgi:hypothetical protein
MGSSITVIGAVDGILNGANVVGIVLDRVVAVPRLDSINGLGIFLVLPLITWVANLALTYFVRDVDTTVHNLLDATVGTCVGSFALLECRGS